MRLNIVLAGLMLTASSVPALAQSRRRNDEPRPAIYETRRGWQVELTPAIEDAIDRYDRDFEPWRTQDYADDARVRNYDYSSRQVPWAAIGDFNGDGRMDIAIAGRTERDAVVLVILSTGRSRYRAIEVDAEPADFEDRHSTRPPVLRYMYPGRYVIDDQRLRYATELVVEQPALEVTGSHRPGPVLYVAKGSGVVPYYLSEKPADAAPTTPRRRSR